MCAAGACGSISGPDTPPRRSLCSYRMPSRRGLRGELVEHSHQATGYAVALAWTHLFLPMFGKADLFQRSAADLMGMHLGWRQILLIWAYTSVVTSLCWWLYVVAENRAGSLTGRSALADHVLAAVWGTLATSLVYVTVWAWICALLSALPTGNPILAFLSGVLITVVAAASVVLGQHGCGPFLLLRGSNPERVKTVVFFTTIMTAMMWVGALDYGLASLFANRHGFPRWAVSWLLALALCAMRWLMIGCSDSRSSHFAMAVRSYPSSPHLALSVGLVAKRRQGGISSDDAPSLSSLPSFRELHKASLGLGALVVAWGGSVALQAASTTTWKAWPFPYASTEAVAPSTAYAMAMTAACVVAVATARAIAESDGKAKERADALAAETAALGVASGWAWYHALECIFPSLGDPSPLTRAIGTLAVTAFGVMVMLALKPPAGTAYADTPVGGSHGSPPRTSYGSGDDPDCAPTSTHYRAFVDMRRAHSADWLPPMGMEAGLTDATGAGGSSADQSPPQPTREMAHPVRRPMPVKLSTSRPLTVVWDEHPQITAGGEPPPPPHGPMQPR